MEVRSRANPSSGGHDLDLRVNDGTMHDEVLPSDHARLPYISYSLQLVAHLRDACRAFARDYSIHAG